MSWFVFIYRVLLLLYFILYESDGKITSPPDGTTLTILPGRNETIIWSFDDDISTVTSRGWTFTSTDGLRTGPLAAVSLNLDLSVLPGILPGITITKPATLVLKNVNQSYDGTYRFSLAANAGLFISNVRVFIAKKPNVTLNCTNHNEINEGDKFTCECRGRDGNPPASVVWYKDGHMFGETKTENNTLTLSNVNETNSGNYTCVAESYPDDQFMDNKTTVVQVLFAPIVKIAFEPECGILGSRSCIVTCESTGFPAPNHTISHNGAVVSTTKTYTIDVVKYSDGGIYKCVAKNTLGNDSNSSYLGVRAKPNVTKNCPSYNEVKKSDDFTCECRDKDGNPRANVIWYKDGNKFGETKTENNTLILRNVDETHSGNYKCVAQNHPGDEFVDEKTIRVQVIFKPNTKITFATECEILSSRCIITCESTGVPSPSHTISHNGTVISTTKTYTIDVMKYSDAGLYECVATNKVGNDSASANLTVTVAPTANITFGPECEILGSRSCIVTCESTGFPAPSHTISHNGVVVSTTKTYIIDVVKYSDAGTYKCVAKNKLGNDSVSSYLTVRANGEDDVVVWHIVVSLVSGIILGFLLSYIIWCSRHRWCKNRKPERNTDAQTNEVDTTYQELDLSKMNTEDNYQSLKENASANNEPANDEEESTYTKLNETRDVENKYQSLT